MSYVDFRIPTRALSQPDNCGCNSWFNGLGSAGGLGAMTYTQCKTAQAARAAQIAAIDANYKNLMKGFADRMAAWSIANQKYKTAMAGWSQAVGIMTSQYLAQAKKIQAANPSLKFPAGFQGCVTQAAHNYYASFDCTVIKGTDGMRGYGGLGATTYSTYGAGPCVAKLLPVCKFPVKPTSPGPAPVAPKKASYPAAIPACVAPRPTAIKAPIVSTVAPKPVVTQALVPIAPAQAPAAESAMVSELPVPDEAPETASPAKKASMIKNGLIALVVVAGGIALYKTFAKPKAAA